MTDEKTPRVIIPLPRELLDQIEDVRFEQRLPSRATAIRMLLAEALQARAKARPPAD